MLNYPILKYSSRLLDKSKHLLIQYYKKIILTLIVILILTSFIYGARYVYNKYTGKLDVIQMKRPFLNVYAVKPDGSEIMTNIVLITHPFTRDECEVQYNEAKVKGMHFLGCSSYSEFPGPISNVHDVLHDPKHTAWGYDYFTLTRGWLSCFRPENNAKWIKAGFPCANITESDFANYEQHKPDPDVKKEYDFIYICLKDGDKKPEDKDCPTTWQAHNRNYEKAKTFLDIMCKKYKLKGLLVGRIGCEMPPNCHQLMELTDFMPYHDFIKTYNKCKFIFLPNFSDASPRCLSEAMCFNLPVLMNSGIVGGWQFLDKDTGAFFDADKPDEFPPILDNFIKKLTNNEYKPRDWFIQNYGKYHSGKRFKAFTQEIFKEKELNFKFSEVDYLKPGI
uniref:Glycosyl transferase family 1 domain-containing protein n=1 Tax=viral metagenome TaxID=1070528 RepID=A0A6C0HMR0_9ZZZZ